MADAVYTKAEIFEIDAETASSLHIGGPDGGNERVLIHPEQKVPVSSGIRHSRGISRAV